MFAEHTKTCQEDSDVGDAFIKEEGRPNLLNDSEKDEGSTRNPVTQDYDPNQRVVSYEQLSILNLVVHPIWIFDYVERRMRWANHAAIEVWNASNLEELQTRSFQEISNAAAHRMDRYIEQFEIGLNVSDQWTLYPTGAATTCHINLSGSKFAEDGDNKHFCYLCEGVPLMKEELIEANSRSRNATTSSRGGSAV